MDESGLIKQARGCRNVEVEQMTGMAENTLASLTSRLAGVDRHIKVGVGKLSAFPLLTFDWKGINGTTYLFCLNISPEQKCHQIHVPTCVLKQRNK